MISLIAQIQDKTDKSITSLRLIIYLEMRQDFFVSYSLCCVSHICAFCLCLNARLLYTPALLLNMMDRRWPHDTLLILLNSYSFFFLILYSGDIGSY